MTLNQIIARLERLSVSHRDPKALHMEKAELVHALRRLAANDNAKPTLLYWRADI